MGSNNLNEANKTRITKSVIVRTILFVIVIINFILERCGVDIIPVSESAILMFVEYAIEFAILAVGFWKNNSYTPAAIEADKFLKELRESE